LVGNLIKINLIVSIIHHLEHFKANSQCIGRWWPSLDYSNYIISQTGKHWTCSS